MIVGIVGCEEAKFTEFGKIMALTMIHTILIDRNVTEVVSGGCHLGGIDIWAIESGQILGIRTTEYLPHNLMWDGFKKRNIQIAERSDKVYCISVDLYPPHFVGMKFNHCYHCNKTDHVKSGGCWTMKYAIEIGKYGQLFIAENYQKEPINDDPSA